MILFCLLACQNSTPKGPQITVEIRPENPSSQDTLSIELQSSEQIELDNPSVQWFQNGVPFDNPSETLDFDLTQKNDEWSVNVLIQANGGVPDGLQ